MAVLFLFYILKRKYTTNFHAFWRVPTANNFKILNGVFVTKVCQYAILFNDYKRLKIKVGMATNGMKLILNFVKIGQLILKLKAWTQTYKGDLVHVHTFPE